MSLDEAKRMFIDYKCSHYFMVRSDDETAYDRYKSFNVDRATEKKWFQEYKDNLKSRYYEEKDLNAKVELYTAITNLIKMDIDDTDEKFVKSIFEDDYEKLDTYLKTRVIADYGNLTKTTLFPKDEVITNVIALLNEVLNDEPIFTEETKEGIWYNYAYDEMSFKDDIKYRIAFWENELSKL